MAESFGTYVKTSERTGKELERHPETMTEVVALEFDGWKKKSSRKSTAGGSSSSKSSNS